MKKFASRIAILLLMVVSIYSCNKDSNFGYAPNLALPLVKAKFSLKDILKKERTNNNIVTDANGFIDLVFKTNLFSKTAEELIPINNQEKNIGFQLNSSELNILSGLANNIANPIPFSYSFQKSIDFDDSIYVDTMVLKSGLLHINVRCDYHYNLNLTLKLPGAKKNGTLLQIPLSKNYTGVSPILIDTLINLANYSFSLDNSNLSNPNLTNIDVSLTFVNNPLNIPPITFQSTDSLYLKLGFEEIKFRRLFARFNKLELLSEPDTIGISIFESALGLGSIRVDNPKLTTKFTNSFGVSVGAIFTKFLGYNNLSSPKTKNITGSGVPLSSQIVVDGAQSLGQSNDTSFTLNNSNSNIVDVIYMQPKKVIYQLKANVNTPIMGFVLDTSKIDIDMELDLPMSGTIDDFVFKDTINYMFDKVDNINSVSFRSNIDNGFPFETNIQVYFANEKNIVLDSLVKDAKDKIVIAAAAVNSNGIVANGVTAKQQSDLVLSASVIPKLPLVRKFIIVARNSSYQKKKIKIYDYYNMEIKLGVKTKLNL